ncbi:biotin--[acetyl-CoA-carboxylase] ligase [Jannaschia pagri]|uniref:biotin--[biotin carboxyl-carrier protein] ligase n=1 Tax=Jannaschia pagri TaxID=2829797 RepID=A0ABQ4NR88_9RHOB|nr:MULTISPECIES: biotin--[acetyl-CoA-carboxylase] ligase [unclassified Jannaschia]GIT92929.1 biotin--[acetyl-CoA-carboxylase] ligase [Jannaschia sp. AI_61]GIT96764.1 biotin--[acetyl-CoA-carboxylase] ligase [Jannaschia sp. AI_62]
MAWPEGVARVILPSIDSTSLEAVRQMPQVPTWFLGLQQTAAKGRRGRAWSMPAGNFAASLIWRPAGNPGDLALRSFVASLALHDVLSGMGVQGLSLKWPNDVLLNGGKLAGILLESPAPGFLVLGMGINLIAAPAPAQVEAGALAPVSLLEASGLRVTPDAMLEALAAAFATREAQLATWGFPPIRTAWMQHAARVGQPVTARMVTETVEGIFEDVDDDGHLVLRTATGQRRITAADVFFGGAPCS